ncbi:nonsense transcript regulator [Apiospora sp. TS-2023a]
MADKTTRQEEFDKEVCKIREKQRRRRTDKAGKRQTGNESLRAYCIILVDEKPVVRATLVPHVAYQVCRPAFCRHHHPLLPQFVETAPICQGPSAQEYELFCRNRKLPESTIEANPVLLNLFVHPDGVDVQVKDQVPSELKWHGDAAVRCFEDFKDIKNRLANLEEQTKLEFIFRGDFPYRLDETIWFADSFVGEQASPLEPLAAKTMSSWKFTRENMLSPREAGFSGHDPAKMRFDNQQERSAKLAYATYFEQLYDEENRDTLETKLFRSHAIGVEATKYQGHYTEYLLTPEVNKSEDMNMMPRPGKEEFDIEVLVRCDIPQPQLPPLKLEGNIVLRGTRIEVPKGLAGLGRVLIVARVPRVRNWAGDAGEAPFYRPHIPTAQVGSSLASTTQMGDQLKEIGKSVLTRDGLIYAFWQQYKLLDADQKALFKDLRSLPFGLLNVFGVPGAGKTHVMVLIVLMTCLDMVNRDAMFEHIDRVAAGDNDTASASQSGSDKPDSGDPSVTGPKGKDAMSAKVKVFVQVASNVQGDDLCEKCDKMIKQLGLKVRVLRLNMIERELRNAASKGYEDDELVYDPMTEMESAVESEMEISKAMAQYRQDKKAQSGVHGGVYSVSEVAWAMVDGAGGTDDLGPDYADVVGQIARLRELRKGDPDLFFTREIKDYRQLWRQLICMIISDADIIVGTPTAAKKIADNPDIDFKPLIVWSDEAGRATEAAGLASFAFFPEAIFRALSGDAKQPHAMIFSGAGKPEDKVKKGEIVNQFVRQLETSILERMGEGRCPVSNLRITHRMRGGLETFPSQQFYEGKMESAHNDFTDEFYRVRHFLGRYGRGVAGPVLMLNMQSYEDQDGTSYLNHTNAGFVVRAVVNAFKQDLCAIHPTETTPGKRARIVIISPYDAQRQLYNELLSRVSDAEFVRDLVDVRTIPHVQGHEGELVFFDTVRTSRLGFLGEPENANVCLTRAKYGLFVIGDLDCWKGASAGPFPEWESYLRECGAVRGYKEANFAVDCARCHQDHDTKKCKGGKRRLRNVPRQTWPSSYP